MGSSENDLLTVPWRLSSLTVQDPDVYADSDGGNVLQSCQECMSSRPSVNMSAILALSWGAELLLPVAEFRVAGPHYTPRTCNSTP